MYTKNSFAVTLLSVLLIGGCAQEKKTELLPVGEMVDYKDPVYGFQIKYPNGWLSAAEVGRARFFSELDVDKKFLDPLGAYPNGAAIQVDVIRNSTPADEAKRLIDEMKAQGYQVLSKTDTSIAGLSATIITYKARFSTSVEAGGDRIFITADSVLYYMTFSGFADFYESHKQIFAASLGSFQLPKPVVKGRDETLPSESFTSHDAKLFSFEYPENFNFRTLPKGKNELVLGLQGVRLDCNIQFDVFGAQKLTVEKVFDQNKGKYKGASSAKTTVGGQDSRYLTYAATKNVERRVYFVVKDNRVFRITMDYYKPQRQEYLTAYEKLLASIKFK